MTGMLASSKAGHDKNKIYIIIREDAEYVWLADGRRRGIADPKKKRKKHIQIIKYYSDEELVRQIQTGQPYSDQEIKKVIEDYQKQQRMHNV